MRPGSFGFVEIVNFVCVQINHIHNSPQPFLPEMNYGYYILGGECGYFAITVTLRGSMQSVLLPLTMAHVAV